MFKKIIHTILIILLLVLPLSIPSDSAIIGGAGAAGGDSITVDTVPVVDPDFVSTGDIDFVDTANTITANINAGVIIETDLDGDVVPVDGDFLQYDSTGTNFTWRSPAEVLSDIAAQPLEATLTDIADGTIAENLINTVNPWADNEVADDITLTNLSQVSDADGATQTLTNKTLNSPTNDVHADSIHEELRNETGATINRGDAVYISGYSVGQNLALVTLADSDGSGTMPSVALVEDSSIVNNAAGEFVEVGTLRGFDTSLWSVGDVLYISGVGTTGNTLTSTKPTGTALIQKVAEVLRSHATLGVVEVFGAGRSNDLPNIVDTKIWIGNASGVPQELALSGDVTMTNAGVVTMANIVESFYWPAGAISADGTNCADPAQVVINSGPEIYTIICTDNDASQFEGHIVMPDSWDAGTVTFELEYIQTAVDTSVLNADVSVQARGSGETVNNTFGTEVAIDDAAVTGSNAVDHTTSGAVTANCTTSCMAGDTLFWRIELDAAGTTTAVATLHIVGVKMEYTSTVGD